MDLLKHSCLHPHTHRLLRDTIGPPRPLPGSFCIGSPPPLLRRAGRNARVSVLILTDEGNILIEHPCTAALVDRSIVQRCSKQFHRKVLAFPLTKAEATTNYLFIATATAGRAKEQASHAVKMVANYPSFILTELASQFSFC